jgi:hypothetical protein
MEKEAESLMERKKAILLLKEIMSFCDSFHHAQAVSIEKENKSGSWELRVFWIPDASDSGFLKKIVAKNGLEIVNVNSRLVFRSPSNEV